MKKLIPALLLFLLAIGACKKESAPPAAGGNTTDTLSLPPDTMPKPNPAATVSGISPSTGGAGTVVTIAGTNFGASATGMTVLFNDVTATIQSVTETAIKVVVPVTSTGIVTVKIGTQTINGPTFTYSEILTKPYVSGDVNLVTQADVDAFVKINQGRSLQITGQLILGTINNEDITSVAGLSIITAISRGITIYQTRLTEAPFLNNLTTLDRIYISDPYLTTLNFSHLTSVSGPVSLLGLTNLTSLHFDQLTNLGSLMLTNCPSLTDITGFDKLTSTGGFIISNAGVSSISLDQLTGVTGALQINACKNLKSISFKSLLQINKPSTPTLPPIGYYNPYVDLSITSCDQLTTANFSALTTIPGKLTVSGTNLADLSGFNHLQTVGALSIYNNLVLNSLQGLSQITKLTSSTFSPGTSSNLTTRLNGIYLVSNPKLTSLAGLQNIATPPIVYIAGNETLSDFCPLKAQITAVSTLPDYSYAVDSGNSGYPTKNRSIAALTMTNNGNYATTQDALTAIALCK